MSPLVTLVQALGVAYASGINLYATVALLGLAQRNGWVGPLPGTLGAVGSWWVIGFATVLYVIEFLATLVPGIASAWETFHSLVRPPAAAALAVATAWHGDALFVLIAALLGGGLALTTHTTKLGLRYAIDTSPEPVTNGAVNIAELGLVASVTFFIWHHPFATMAIALAVLIALIVVVRLIWRVLRRVFRGNWMPRPGLMQSPRCSAPRVSQAMRAVDEEPL
jgi:Na+-transporting methylmalonyl-CoA/oxaloacetate decarboxylase gamma subunit